MAILGAGVDLVQDEIVGHLDPAPLLAQPGEPVPAPNLRQRRLAVSDLLAVAHRTRIAAAAADVGALPGLVIVGVELVMVRVRLRHVTVGPDRITTESTPHRPIRMMKPCGRLPPSMIGSVGTYCDFDHRTADAFRNPIRRVAFAWHGFGGTACPNMTG